MWYLYHLLSLPILQTIRQKQLKEGGNAFLHAGTVLHSSESRAAKPQQLRTFYPQSGSRERQTLVLSWLLLFLFSLSPQVHCCPQPGWIPKPQLTQSRKFLTAVPGGLSQGDSRSCHINNLLAIYLPLQPLIKILNTSLSNLLEHLCIQLLKFPR